MLKQRFLIICESDVPALFCLRNVFEFEEETPTLNCRIASKHVYGCCEGLGESKPDLRKLTILEVSLLQAMAMHIMGTR